MKFGILFCGAVVLAALFVGCGSPTSSSSSNYSMKILPSNLGVNIPSSLKSSTGTSSSVETSRSVLTPSFAVTYSSSSGAYTQVKSAADSIVSVTKTMVIMAVAVDAILTQNSLGPGTYPSVNVTITKDLYNTMMSVWGDGEGGPPSSLVGTKQTISNLVYSTSETGTFKNKIYFENDAGDGTINKTTIVWAADSSKVKITQVSSYGTSVIAKDFSNASTAYGYSGTYSGSSYTAKVAVVEKANSNKGVYVYQSYVCSANTYSASGFADNSGGLLQSSFSAGSYTGYSWREGFSGTGGLLYTAYATDSPPTSWTAVTNTDTTPVTNYAADATSKKAESGALPLLNS